jgi:lysophospholipid acyltransferase (LPLAT)-like uncharacterized protein
MNPRVWLSARGLYLYSQVVRITARYEIVDGHHLDDLERSGRPIIFTSWHGTAMMIAGCLIGRLSRGISNVLVIVPDDWRGETLSEWARLLGARAFAVGMEDQTLSGARRFLQLVRQLENGTYSLIAPDGPDGPSGVPKPGISYLAGRAGAAILPLGLTTRTRYQLRRWDRYSVPLPFSRITMVVGEPLTIGREEPAEVSGGRIATAINDVMAEAERTHGQR